MSHAATPNVIENDASTGVPPDDFGPSIACHDWSLATDDRSAQTHTSFPELRPEGCFVRVRYDGSGVRADPIPFGCGYPDTSSIAILEERASIYEAAATSWRSLRRVPMELDCDLPDDVRRSAALQNARTLRSLARAWSTELPIAQFPYAAVGTFGFGEPKQNLSVLARWRPEQGCVGMSPKDVGLFEVNVQRARRAAEAYHAGIAPVVTVSGSAVHSKVYEAFFLAHLVRCNFDVPSDRILVDVCADHTHTNVRNTGALIESIGGRFGYLVTDDFIQSAYLQEWTVFDLIGGSIDQRAARDFGYSLGSWRQASVGMHAGFWYTPFRFWAGPRGGLGTFSCIGDVEQNESGG